MSILEAYLRALCPFSFLAAFLFLAGACSHETQEVEQWTDLLSKVDAPVEVRDLGGDRRPALTLNPEYPFSFGPSPGGTDCRLRLAFDSQVGEESRQLKIRLESWSESRIVFDQNLDSLSPSSTPWQDLEIGLGSQDGSYHLVAQVSGGRLSLASPHALCRVSRPGSRPSRPHVLLVSIDTLRRDRLGVYGYHRNTTPSLDSFAETALVFEQAFAVAPWTLPSHASIFTGLYPDQHGAGHSSAAAKLGEGPSTLAELLGNAGYRTVGISAGGFAGRAFGLDRGFDVWVENTRANLGASFPSIMERLSEPTDAPLFLFLHTFDVHGPYESRPSAPQFPSEPLPAEREERWTALRDEPLLAYLEPQKYPRLADLEAAYDSGVAAVDKELGRILQALEDYEILDDTLVVITSDHGESLLEHGDYVGHSFSFHDQEIQIPLLVRFPGAEPSGRWNGLVDHTDLAPLILEAVGIVAPEMSGASPVARHAGLTSAREWVRGEAVNLGARYARSESWMLVTPYQQRVDRGRPLPAGIQAGFANREPRWLPLAAGPEDESSRSVLARALIGVQSPGQRGNSPEALDSEVEARLRTLGYLDLD